jgi:hypothetical protein
MKFLEILNKYFQLAPSLLVLDIEALSMLGVPGCIDAVDFKNEIDHALFVQCPARFVPEYII